MLHSSIVDFFYQVKPIIPRQTQLLLRRNLILSKLKKCKDVWPIDERAAQLPDNWRGWPEGKKFALLLTHDVDTLKGYNKCMSLLRVEESMGFRSAFGFVPERDYSYSPTFGRILIDKGFEVYVHDLKHDGKLFKSEQNFRRGAKKINSVLKEWGSCGFRAGAMHCNFDWLRLLNIAYDASSFDTDPFEPKSVPSRRIFPYLIKSNGWGEGYVELPYTLPQDFTLFVLMGEKNIIIWKKKLDWIADHGGMVLLNTHPDYMSFKRGNAGKEEYPVQLYEDFLVYVKKKYENEYWNVLPREMAKYWIKRPT